MRCGAAGLRSPGEPCICKCGCIHTGLAAEEEITGLGGFEPPASGLEARRYVQAKPQAQVCASNFRAWG